MSNFCVCYLHSILKEVFVCGFVILFLFFFGLLLLHLSVCFYPYDLFHILLLALQNYGSMKYMYVRVCM